MALLPRRIIKETQRLLQEPVPGISAIPDESNARYFHVIVTGPQDSPFEGKFKFFTFIIFYCFHPWPLIYDTIFDLNLQLLFNQSR